MFIVKCGNIFNFSVEAIVVESNVFGTMGKGLALEVKNKAGEEVEKEAKRICRENEKIKEGTSFSTKAGDLTEQGIKRIFHAVISQSSGGLTSSYNIENSIRSLLENATRQGIKTIAMPGIGLEGMFDVENIAILMANICKKFANNINIIIIDKNENFINTLKGLMK